MKICGKSYIQVNFIATMNKQKKKKGNPSQEVWVLPEFQNKFLLKKIYGYVILMKVGCNSTEPEYDLYLQNLKLIQIIAMELSLPTSQTQLICQTQSVSICQSNGDSPMKNGNPNHKQPSWVQERKLLCTSNFLQHYHSPFHMHPSVCLHKNNPAYLIAF